MHHNYQGWETVLSSTTRNRETSMGASIRCSKGLAEHVRCSRLHYCFNILFTIFVNVFFPQSLFNLLTTHAKPNSAHNHQNKLISCNRPNKDALCKLPKYQKVGIWKLSKNVIFCILLQRLERQIGRTKLTSLSGTSETCAKTSSVPSSACPPKEQTVVVKFRRNRSKSEMGEGKI